VAVLSVTVIVSAVVKIFSKASLTSLALFVPFFVVNERKPITSLYTTTLPPTACLTASSASEVHFTFSLMTYPTVTVVTPFSVVALAVGALLGETVGNDVGVEDGDDMGVEDVGTAVEGDEDDVCIGDRVGELVGGDRGGGVGGVDGGVDGGGVGGVDGGVGVVGGLDGGLLGGAGGVVGGVDGGVNREFPAVDATRRPSRNKFIEGRVDRLV